MLWYVLGTLVSAGKDLEPCTADVDFGVRQNRGNIIFGGTVMPTTDHLPTNWAHLCEHPPLEWAPGIATFPE